MCGVGGKILLIIDEADALFFKRNYVPVFPPKEYERELELWRAYARFFIWLVRNYGVVHEGSVVGFRLREAFRDFDAVFKRFKEFVGVIVRRKDSFLRELLVWVLGDVIKLSGVVNSIYKLFVRFCESCGYDPEDVLNNDKLFKENVHRWGEYFCL